MQEAKISISLSSFPAGPRVAVRGLALLAIVLALAACGHTKTVPLPEMDMVATTNWWVTTPEVQLDRYTSMDIQVTFKNDSGTTVEFTGAPPADDIQIWSNPSVGSPDATFAVFPSGTYLVGETFEWNISLDLSSLPSGETSIAIRPYASPLGTVGPTSFTLVDATIALVE